MATRQGGRRWHIWRTNARKLGLWRGNKGQAPDVDQKADLKAPLPPSEDEKKKRELKGCTT